MCKMGLFYGSNTGNTKRIAEKIAAKLGAENVELKNINNVFSEDFKKFDKIILGSSTWGYGELQDDWSDFFPKFDNINFTGKKVALFGVGDQNGFSDTFVDAMGIIYEKVVSQNAKVIGFTSTDNYFFSSSKAVAGNKFVGLALDEDSQSSLTDKRLENWVDMILSEFNN